jgi:hypothetical protein
MCGGPTPRWNGARDEEQGGVEPPHSKVFGSPQFNGANERQPAISSAAEVEICIYLLHDSGIESACACEPEYLEPTREEAHTLRFGIFT